MKRILKAGFFLLSFSVGQIIHAATVPVKIMPIGDSITQANSGHDSYRYALWNKLKAGGYSVDFVGSLSKPFSGSYVHSSGWDTQHEGHWGWRADQILANISSWAGATRPDIALIHLGSNDLNQYQTPANAASEISSIIARLRAVNPRITVLVAQIIPSAKKDANGVPYVNNNIIGPNGLNAKILALAASLNNSTSRVVAVDQYTGFSTSDLYDTFHPKPSGEEKIATKWYAALRNFLVPGSVTPEPPPASGGTVYQAESAVLFGAKAVGGYVDYINASGDYIEWTITAAKAGVHNLGFRYALSSGNRPLQIKVNGVVVQSSLSFPSTGSLSNYATVTIQATLPAGTNKVRATAIGASGANVDSLTVTAL